MGWKNDQQHLFVTATTESSLGGGPLALASNYRLGCAFHNGKLHWERYRSVKTFDIIIRAVWYAYRY